MKYFGKYHPRIQLRHFHKLQQKDNKYDGWVTVFVDALKTELRANLKEDVLFYLVENQNDRLQETNHFSKCLEGKLQCLACDFRIS